MLFTIILVLIVRTDCFSINFLQNAPITKELTQLINLKYNKGIILNGEKTLIKRDYCKIICDLNNLNFIESDLRSYLDNMPYNYNINTMFYINNFLINNGQVISESDQNQLLNIPKTSNLLILQADNLEKIPIKDNYLIKKFKIINFTKIWKKQIINYIYEIIKLNNYSENLYLINWNKFTNVEKLNLEKINILLFEVNSMIDKIIDINIINNEIIYNEINYLINSLEFIPGINDY
jgi:hypothetical protein